MISQINENQWKNFEQKGYLHLGSVMDNGELGRLQQRIDEIMLGTADIDYSQIMMQLDRDPDREGKQPGPQTKGHKGSTLCYRKIQNLEIDPLFLSFMRKPIFKQICERIYGDKTPISSYRAMFMNKPSGEGTPLVWHQDRWSELNIDPLITVWTALDSSFEANGCVKILPGSHRQLLNPSHGAGFLTREQAREIESSQETISMEVEIGGTVLMHNWLLHSSGINRTNKPRRAFSVCFMDAKTRSRGGQPFPIIFGNRDVSSETE